MERSASSSEKKKVKKKLSKKGDSSGKSKAETSTTKRKSYRKSGRNYLDDDDFSVAPSMDQDVKSVVSVSFDDVYARGRKVSNLGWIVRSHPITRQPSHW